MTSGFIGFPRRHDPSNSLIAEVMGLECEGTPFIPSKAQFDCSAALDLADGYPILPEY